MKLLRIDSSARRNSVSRQLTERFVESWKQENPAGEVVERDLATTQLPLITDEWALAAHTDPAVRTPAQQETLSVSDTRGGAFRPGTPTAPFDHQEPYLRHILTFMGLTDVTFIHAENQKPGGPLAEPSRTAAIAQLQAAAHNRSIAAPDLTV